MIIVNKCDAAPLKQKYKLLLSYTIKFFSFGTPKKYTLFEASL